MALYSMYPQSSQMLYQDSQRARQQALQSQLAYYTEQHNVHQSQGLGLSEATASYPRPYATTYDHMSLGYPMTQPAYTSGLTMAEEMHHGYPYPRLLQSGLLPGMADEADTASRPRLTAEQTRELEVLYIENSKPSTQQKHEYAQRFRLTKNRVDNWFQNRRAKSKHQNKAKQTEVTTENSRSSSKEVSDRQDFSGYQVDNNSTSLDLLATAPFNKDQGQELISEDDYMPSEQNSWRSTTNERATRQSSTAHTEYSHTSDFGNSKQILGSESCQSPSPVSLKSFDYPITTTYSSHAGLIADYPPEAFARRGSALSDLTSNINGIQLPSEPSSASEMFSMEPRRGFAERRQQRPAALSGMRSTSSGSTLRSPLMTINTLPKSLRRINTCGTPLNKTGRIQKHGVATPQKSPGAMSQALERTLDQLTPHLHPGSPEAVQVVKKEEGADARDGGLVFNVNPPSADVSWNENINGDFSVPPLSASLTGDDGSPPLTPLPGHESFTNPWVSQEMSSATSMSVPTYAHPSPLLLQQEATDVECMSSQQQQQQQMQPFPLHQVWDGTSVVSDMFSLTGNSSSFDFGSSNSVNGSSATHMSRSVSGSASLSSHSPYGYMSNQNNNNLNNHSGMSSRRHHHHDDEPLKIEFSLPLQEALPQHYYVPLRGKNNFVFHEYNPELSRRSE